MKNGIVWLLATFLIVSCQTDPCADRNCQNGAPCINGECDCPDGYSGVLCQIYDPCSAITCLNGSTCVTGTCNCAVGYEGTYCQTVSRDKFMGWWTAIETCSGNSYQYSMNVMPGSHITEIYMVEQQGGQTISVRGTVNGNQLSIPHQNIIFNGTSYTVNGYGSIAGNTLQYEYTAYSQGNSTSCTVFCTR